MPGWDDRPRVLLVSGLSGRAEDVEVALRILEAWSGQARASRRPHRRAMPLSQTSLPGEAREAVRPPTLRRAGTTTTRTVPKSATCGAGPAYSRPTWSSRFGQGDSAKWEVNEAAETLAAALDAVPVLPPDGFVGAIGRGVPEGIGSVPGVRLTAGLEEAPEELDRLWPVLADALVPSCARIELDRRRTRSPVEIGRALASAYGRTIEPVVYTQGVAISGRLRLAALDPGIALSGGRNRRSSSSRWPTRPPPSTTVSKSASARTSPPSSGGTSSLRPSETAASRTSW